MAQILSGDIIVIANTTYASNNIPFVATLNYQPFCPTDVPSCMAAGKCDTGGGVNEFFYTLSDMQEATVPYSYPQYYVFAVEPGSNGGYITLANGTPITAGMLVGFQSVPNSSYMQTGPQVGVGFDDRIQLQADSWTDESSDSDYRVFLFVTTSGEGQNGLTTNVAISYGIAYFIQSWGKYTQNNNEQYWKVGDPKYECSVSTQDLKSLPDNTANYVFYVYDKNGGGAPIVYANNGLPLWQWILIVVDVILLLIVIVVIIFVILRILNDKKKKRAKKENADNAEPPLLTSTEEEALLEKELLTEDT